MPGHWLVKTEPGTFSFDDLARVEREPWDGVRNAQARNNLQAMSEGDPVLVYHSNKGREVVGTATVVRAAYPDPTTDDERWVCVDLQVGERFAQPVTLASIKADPKLAEIPLVKQSRLSVMPLPAAAFRRICRLGGVEPPARGR